MIITKNHIELSATELTEFTSEELYVIMGIDPSKPCGEAEISYAESQRLWTEINGDFFATDTEEDSDVFCSLCEHDLMCQAREALIDMEAGEQITQTAPEKTAVCRKLPRNTSF
jgi:hypothetical protein